MQNTTIAISEKLKKELESRKFRNETYEEVIWELIEDAADLNDKTLTDIETARKDFAHGKSISHETLMKKVGLR